MIDLKSLYPEENLVMHYWEDDKGQMWYCALNCDLSTQTVTIPRKSEDDVLEDIRKGDRPRPIVAHTDY